MAPSLRVLAWSIESTLIEVPSTARALKPKHGLPIIAEATNVSTASATAAVGKTIAYSETDPVCPVQQQAPWVEPALRRMPRTPRADGGIHDEEAVTARAQRLENGITEAGIVRDGP